MFSKEFVRSRQPYGIYDTRNCALIHIGLYTSIAECWQLYLGWPTAGEIIEAKQNGLHCIPITCHYQLPEEENEETST
jgi:hypothetical protein